MARGSGKLLSRKEAVKEALRLKKEGKTYDEIAEIMQNRFVSPKTGTPISGVGWRRNVRIAMAERGDRVPTRGPGTSVLLREEPTPTPPTPRSTEERPGTSLIDTVRNIVFMERFSPAERIDLLKRLLRP